MAFPKIDGYVVTEKLGSGSYSTVYKAYTKVGGRSVVAIKCVDKSRVKASGAAVDNLVTEIRLLRALRHPHIVHMDNFTWDHKNIYIIMEYCCGGDLSKYIARCGRVPEQQVLYFLQQLASALKYLREKGVVHLDLKPHNLLLHKDSTGKYILKVADFGFAAHLQEESAGEVRGSPLYMAPEVLRGRYDARADLWSVGVIMYECLFGRAPYASNTMRELMDKIQRADPIQLPANSSISAGCRGLLRRLLRHAPAARLTHEQFFADEYLDLPHMPTKENYDKAVTLIKRAIELDCGGRLQEAFPLYTDALRLLVPCVRAETDACRRGALTTKLTRYMERAEEIKLYLKRKDAPSTVQPANVVINSVDEVTYKAGACACDAATAVSASETAAAAARCACVGPSGSGTERCECGASASEVNGTVEQPAPATECETSGADVKPAPRPGKPEPGGGGGGGGGGGAEPRGAGLRRLFARTRPSRPPRPPRPPPPPLPPLEKEDSSISAGTTKDTSPDSQDACRIA